MFRLNHEYHGVELRYPVSREVFDWLKEKHGDPTGDVWYMRGNTVYFARQQDHMMFLLKWG